MDATISGRDVEVTEVMEKHIRDHIRKLPRYDDRIGPVTVTLKRDASGEQVEIIAKCHRSVLVAKASSYDMYNSIEQAFARMRRRIARLHDKLTSHHRAQEAAESNKEPEQ